MSPDGMQRLLRTADWEVDGVRDDVRGYVLDGLGDPDADPDAAGNDSGAGVFIADLRRHRDPTRAPAAPKR